MRCNDKDVWYGFDESEVLLKGIAEAVLALARALRKEGVAWKGSVRWGWSARIRVRSLRKLRRYSHRGRIREVRKCACESVRVWTRAG